MTQRVTTVRDVMESVFPNGYLDHPQYLVELASTKKRRGRKKTAAAAAPFANPPCSAPDLFALMGQLLLKSGAYHHVCPQVDGAPSSDMILVTAAERSRWAKIGAEWRGKCNENLPAPPTGLVGHWQALMGYGGERVFRSPGYTLIARKWWQHALALFAIADEASLDIGFRMNDEPSAQAQFIEAPLRLAQAAGRRGAPLSISKASTDTLCVLPKSRTTAVGCTLRSLSHNLAILPGRGVAQARWSLAPMTATLPKDGDPDPFNLVVLPLPYRIESKAFKAFPAPKGDWGWFEVEPHWCPPSVRDVEPIGFSEFAVFIDAILDEAARDCGTVHALVFPEVALSEEVFRALCRHLQSRAGFELLISGLFDGRKPGPASASSAVRNGNFAGMARFVRTAKSASFDISVREKHHRWRLDRGQIETYALGSALDVNRNWWEHIDILQRSLDIFVLRGGATVTTLICEDLARNDPCQELVRGIGPNFVVALLMDGPQRKDRWPARYGTVLADDPGSSVLSLTSYGLVHRCNETGAYPPASQIGLFRDDTGRATELHLPSGAQGVCLTLQPTVLTEHTLDGRPDKNDAQSWRLSAVQPVRAKIAGDDVILRGGWPAGRA